jgi:hypothetical protein
MSPNDQVQSVIRTYVPYAVGAVLAWLLAKFTIDLTGEFQAALIAFVVVVVQNVYYFVIRLAETKLPMLGVLLGLPGKPTYGGVSDLWASVVRTGIPTIVGALVAVVASVLGNVDVEATAGFTVFSIAVAQAAYYALAQVAAERFPALTFLLGTGSTPSYEAKHAA